MPGLAPTNNFGEQEIRPAVVVRKISAGNRTLHVHEIAASVSRTAERNGRALAELLPDLLRARTGYVCRCFPAGPLQPARRTSMDSVLSAKALCEAMGGTYDEEAARICHALERTLSRLRLERFGHFAGVINAIENHVEEGDGDPGVVRHIGDALLALAALHRLDARVVKRLTQLRGSYTFTSSRALRGKRVHLGLA